MKYYVVTFNPKYPGGQADTFMVEAVSITEAIALAKGYYISHYDGCMPEGTTYVNEVNDWISKRKVVHFEPIENYL